MPESDARTVDYNLEQRVSLLWTAWQGARDGREGGGGGGGGGGEVSPTEVTTEEGVGPGGGTVKINGDFKQKSATKGPCQ